MVVLLQPISGLIFRVVDEKASEVCTFKQVNKASNPLSSAPAAITRENAAQQRDAHPTQFRK